MAPEIAADGAGADGAAHLPVMAERVVELLAPALGESGAVLLDATVGLGGHAQAVLRTHPEVEFIGLDRDSFAIERARERLAQYGQRVRLVHARFDRLDEVLAAQGVARVDAVLFDLGVSSMQLDQTERGFSYSTDAALDMRMDPSAGRTAADVLNSYPAAELTRVLREYGEERFAARIAKAVVAAREQEPFTHSERLVRLLYDTVPAASRRSGGHPAKRTFQALRIEVNGELEVLRTALPQALTALATGGRIVVESYHSLEDRIVKRALAELATSRTPEGLPVELPGHGPQLRLLTRGAEQADGAEIERNSRARPVRLRAAQRIEEAPT